jgi:hypothetical protein
MRPAARTTVVALVYLLLTVAWTVRPTAAQTPLLQVQRSDAGKLMQVNDDAGLVAAGTEGIGTIPASGAGPRLMWYSAKAAFRAGTAFSNEWDDSNVGVESAAMGIATIASGLHSTALGNSSQATGGNATAMSNQTVASGTNAVAMGFRTTASGLTATAIGSGTVASGTNGFATGANSTASGRASTAMGTNATAVGVGSFAYADGTGTGVSADNDNQFVVRASGGYVFYSGTDNMAGCFIPAGQGISCSSSRLVKDRFEDLDADSILGKVAALKIQRWSYRRTAARHVGPFAEDFHAAFGLGDGSRTISLVDVGGINLVAVQALARRVVTLEDERTALRAEFEALRAETAALRTELNTVRDLVRPAAPEQPTPAYPEGG